MRSAFELKYNRTDCYEHKNAFYVRIAALLLLAQATGWTQSDFRISTIKACIIVGK